MIYAFLLEWWERLQQTTPAAVVDGFLAAASHVPVNYHWIADTADFEEQVFILSIQLIEDLRKDEEAFAPGGWQMCKVFAQARRMETVAKGDSSPDGAVRLMEMVSYAKGSDYKVKKNDKKGSSRCWRCFIVVRPGDRS
jgi:hypothetical protein